MLAMQALVTDQKGNSDFPSTAATRAAADAALSSLQMAGAVAKLLRVRTVCGLHERWEGLSYAADSRLAGVLTCCLCGCSSCCK